ncbi:MAG TPA: UvrD-helicase domain-containing protein, partial [Acidobacteriota bacterium]|nr:UvrD-helicase domain-containing protein [Acidobacteriota bacterium]
MPLEQITITDQDIVYAEETLLPPGERFDEERRVYIRSLATLDLQAVPGSGKTTALLAKLLVIERSLPLDDGVGVLVLSHTNIAVDEIKGKIGRLCPKLLAYPNFVGTIQSFVDQFLAIPFGHSYLGIRFATIDTERYQELLWQKYQAICWAPEFDKPARLFWRRHHDRCLKEAGNDESEAKRLYNERVEADVRDLFYDMADDKIKKFSTRETIVSDPQNRKYLGLKTIIWEVLKKGVLSYEYAYRMAEALLRKAPTVTRLLRKRFRFVFVDEMQDM